MKRICVLMALVALGILAPAGWGQSSGPCLTVEEARQLTPAPPAAVPHAQPATKTRYVLGLPVTYYPNKYDPVKTARSFERQTWNTRAFAAVYMQRRPKLDLLFTLLLWLGKGWVIAPVALWLLWKRRALLWPLGIALVTETVVVNVLKGVYDIGRPGVTLPYVHPLESVYWRAFPSGDVAMVCALLFSLFPAFPWWARVASVLFAALIAVERVYVGAHFPLDVLTGAAIGTVCACLATGVVSLWQVTHTPATAE